MASSSFEMASPYLPVDNRQVGGKRRSPLVLCLGLVSVVGVVLIRRRSTGSESGSSALGAAPPLVSQTVSGTYSLRVSLEFRDGTKGDSVQEGYKTLAFDAAAGRSYKRTQLSDGSGGERVLVTIEDPRTGLATFFANSSRGSHWQSTCESFRMTGPQWPPEWTEGVADRARRSNNSACIEGAVPCEQSRRTEATRAPGQDGLSRFRSISHEEIWSEWPAGDRVPGSAKRKTEDFTWSQDERGALSSVRNSVDVALVDPEVFWNTSEVFASVAVSVFNITHADIGVPDTGSFELQSSWGPCSVDKSVEPTQTLSMTVQA